VAIYNLNYKLWSVYWESLEGGEGRLAFVRVSLIRAINQKGFMFMKCVDVLTHKRGIMKKTTMHLQLVRGRVV
jgi:hypothetical protein